MGKHKEISEVGNIIVEWIRGQKNVEVDRAYTMQERLARAGTVQAM